MIDEGMIDHWIDEAVRCSKGSDTRLKFACRAASKVVGEYSEATRQIAVRTKRSVSTVENWAHAYWLVEALREVDITQAALCWRHLPASHWWLAWEKIHQAGYEAKPYLKSAMENGWSGRDMLMEFDRDLKAGNAPIQYKRAVHSFRGLATELLDPKKKYPLTAAQASAVGAVLAAFEEAK